MWLRLENHIFFVDFMCWKELGVLNNSVQCEYKTKAESIEWMIPFSSLLQIFQIRQRLIVSFDIRLQ